MYRTAHHSGTIAYIIKKARICTETKAKNYQTPTDSKNDTIHFFVVYRLIHPTLGESPHCFPFCIFQINISNFARGIQIAVLFVYCQTMAVYLYLTVYVKFTESKAILSAHQSTGEKHNKETRKQSRNSQKLKRLERRVVVFSSFARDQHIFILFAIVLQPRCNGSRTTPTY